MRAASPDLQLSPMRAHRVRLQQEQYLRSQSTADDLREEFEGKEDYETLRLRLGGRTMKPCAKTLEVDKFLQMMRDRGGGSIALAWRRYFDSDGDGELSFNEFCGALASVQYKGDVPGLWRDLGGTLSNALGLEALDPDNAAVLDTFSNWCVASLGGPIEVFRAIDADASDSLTADEFAEGLRELGFFDVGNLPDTLQTEELVLQNLYPLLDQSGHGCITPDQLLFLEKDKHKRSKIERQLARIREHGAEAAPEPLRKDAERFLHSLSIHTTYLGGKHWKSIGNSILEDPSICFDPDGTDVKVTFGRKSMARGMSLLVPRGPRAPEGVQLPSAVKAKAQTKRHSSRKSMSRSSSTPSFVRLPSLDTSSKSSFSNPTSPTSSLHLSPKSSLKQHSPNQSSPKHSLKFATEWG